jgi:hypothetical protein
VQEHKIFPQAIALASRFADKSLLFW